MHAWQLLNHSAFQPSRLFSHPHVQTIISSLRPNFLDSQPQKSHEILLEDGDKVLVMENRHEAWQPGDRIVLLLHGLSGCYLSAYMSRLATMLQEEGYLVLRMNLRSSGPGISLARNSYHSGRSDDCLAVLKYFKEMFPSSGIHLMGFSLGGNIILKLAGELGTELASYCDGLVSVSPPIDLVLSSHKISQPENRFYDQYFVKRLVKHVATMEECFPDLPKTEFPSTMTLRLFDELYTAKRNGFRDAADYYAQSSAGPLLKHIKVKTLLVTAKDDPIVDYKPFLSHKYSSSVQLALTDHGGHTGFMEVGLKGRRYWIDSLLLAFVKQAGVSW